MMRKLVLLALLIAVLGGTYSTAFAAETAEEKRTKVLELSNAWIGSNVKYLNSPKSKIINLKTYNPKKVPSTVTLDCSSFSASVFLTAINVNIPRTADAQKNRGSAVAYRINKDGTINGDLKVGDLIFLDYDKDHSPDHVMIYAGNQYFIQMGGHGIRKYHFTSPWTNNRPVGSYVCAVRRIIR